MRHFNLTEKHYCHVDELKDLDGQFDYFVCGSDQIWNICCPDADDAYFLCFANRGVKIAYAPSLGGADLAKVAEKPEKYKKMLEEIDSFGVEVDIVLNNAGMQIAYRTDYFATPVEDYTESFKINTVAPAMICYHFLPKMIKKGFGRILNTTSGIRLEPEQAGYSASKAALDKITIDLGSKINGTDVMINLTDPGWCRTDLGGPNAPNSPESVIPGIVVGAFVDDKLSGRYFGAQSFAGMTLEEAVKKAESEFKAPY
jgi:short-subunit dehydrogenase